jgi:hypothetical protein
LCGPQSQSGRSAEEKSFAPGGIQTPDCPACSLIAMPTPPPLTYYIIIIIIIIIINLKTPRVTDDVFTGIPEE